MWTFIKFVIETITQHFFPLASEISEGEGKDDSHSVVSDSQGPHGLYPTRLLSMEISRQAYWRELPFSSPGDLPDPGIEP